MMIFRFSQHGLSGRWKCRPAALLCGCALLIGLASTSRALAVTPESPEVQKLVNKALAFLGKSGDERLGARCLLGLTYLKANRADHPRVKEALEACRETVRANPPDSALDVYSNGLAIIFLCELSPQTHAREIEWYLGRLKARQKSHGGWGYDTYATGDTSQTQYAALSYWAAHRHGFNIDGASLENLADWLMKTQGPDGCWGYQGQLSLTGKPVEQTETNCSMLAAGLGSLYICADLLDVRPGAAAESANGAANALPAALRAVGELADPAGGKKIRAQRTNSAQLLTTFDRAHVWMSKNYKIDIGVKRYYYLYGLERYKSFQEASEGAIEPEPTWYNEGYEFLAHDQAADGSWSGYCGPECDTAFAVLFLLRSTQKSLRSKLSEGTLLAGRGLPTNLARAKMRNGQLFVEQVHTKVDVLLSMIDDDDGGLLLDELARDPSQLVVEDVDPQSARRLQQLVRSGEPEVRLLAVRALGRAGNLDYVPSLLYALTDPDRRIVLEARDALRFISRKFDGFGPPDNFTEQQRFDALNAWKKWYQSLRPAAILEQ